MKFIYDSLETVKWLKHPTRRQYVTLTIAIFLLVIFAWLLFIFSDAVFTSVYNFIYHIFW